MPVRVRRLPLDPKTVKGEKGNRFSGRKGKRSGAGRFRTGSAGEKKNSIFDFPAVRVITITTGSLLLLACILFLLAYLRRSVKIYNDDGEGKLHY